MPKFYVKLMVELEDSLTESLKKDKGKKKSTSNTKAMNNLRQKLKKLSKQYGEYVTAYREVKPFSLCGMKVYLHPIGQNPEEFMKEQEQPGDESKAEDEGRGIQETHKEITAEEEDGFTAVGAGGKAIVNLTSENVLARLREVLESRGRKVKNDMYAWQWMGLIAILYRTQIVLNRSTFWNLC